MNWALAIHRNRTALLAVVAAIVALLGGREAGAGGIARSLRSAALALLRPAESAARRLIVIAARGLAAPPPRPRPLIPGAGPAAEATGIATAGDGGGGLRGLAFRLFDRPKRYAVLRALPRAAGVPRIRTFWGATQPTPAPAPGKARIARPDPAMPVAAGLLFVRLAALEAALADLPRQARRLARWRAREAAGREPMRARRGLGPRGPLRFGPLPGWRSRAGRGIDEVLGECHRLALDALRADTS
jgi:hypothetical protein